MSKHVRCQSKHSPFLNDWCGECNQLWPCEVARLEQWKAEATEVIEAWERVWDALGRPGRLGELRTEAALREVEGLKALVTALTLENGTLRADLRVLGSKLPDDRREALIAVYAFEAGVEEGRASGDEEPTRCPTCADDDRTQASEWAENICPDPWHDRTQI